MVAGAALVIALVALARARSLGRRLERARENGITRIGHLFYA